MIVKRMTVHLKPIGVNTCKDVPHPERYTGKCWRGTASTFLADTRHTAAQIQSVIGHRSEAALQEFIDNSSIQMQSVANGLSLKNRGEESSPPQKVQKVLTLLRSTAAR